MAFKSHLKAILIPLVICQLTIDNATSQTPGRRYWPVSVDSLATGKVPHTHVQTVGRVRLIRRELDGDWHLKLTGVRGFVILEIIPGLPLPLPKVGDRIRAFGIEREDHEHQWIELHPLEKWEPAP